MTHRYAPAARPSVTGARLAVDLHRRRCHGAEASGKVDTSLDVAIRQLDLIELQSRQMMDLARPPRLDREPVDPAALEELFLRRPEQGELLRAKGVASFAGWPARNDGSCDRCARDPGHGYDCGNCRDPAGLAPRDRPDPQP